MQQLAAAYGKLKTSTETTVAEILSVCSEAGVSSATIAKAQEVVTTVAEDTPAYGHRLLIVLLTMSAKSLADALAGLFDVFAEEGEIASEQFVALFGYLADQDTALAAAQEGLAAEIGAFASVGLEAATGLPSIAALLTAA